MQSRTSTRTWPRVSSGSRTAIGLVSLEDILEEIVGEIADEFDVEEVDMLSWHDGSLVAAGAAPIQLAAGELGTEISNPHEATSGGHVLELLGGCRIPARSSPSTATRRR